MELYNEVSSFVKLVGSL